MRRIFAALFVGFAFCIAAAHATSLARMSLEQLTSAADAIAQVQCVSTSAGWQDGAIWTRSKFRVVKTLKGELGAEVAVRLPGGRVGHLKANVDGAPQFSPGEEAIVFLARTKSGDYSVAGWVEGTFHIERDARTRRRRVTQESSAFAVFDLATRQFRSEGIRRMPIEEFRSRVAAAMAREKERIP